MTIYKVFIFILGILICQISFGRVDLDQTNPVIFPHNPAEEDEITSKDVEKVIPTDITPTNDASQVANRIADKSIKLWADTYGKDNSLVRTAKVVEKKMKTEVAVKASEDPSAINHRFKFNVKAFETLAEVEYLGWTRALMNYNFRDQKSQVKISEKVMMDKDLTITQESNTLEKISSIGLTWKW